LWNCLWHMKGKNMFELILGVLAAALLVYLVVAMLKPEWFA